MRPSDADTLSPPSEYGCDQRDDPSDTDNDQRDEREEILSRSLKSLESLLRTEREHEDFDEASALPRSVAGSSDRQDCSARWLSGRCGADANARRRVV